MLHSAGVLNKTSKLKIFNKNSKGLGTTEKQKKQEATQIGRKERNKRRHRRDDNTVPNPLVFQC